MSARKSRADKNRSAMNFFSGLHSADTSDSEAKSPTSGIPTDQLLELVRRLLLTNRISVPSFDSDLSLLKSYLTRVTGFDAAATDDATMAKFLGDAELRWLDTVSLCVLLDAMRPETSRGYKFQLSWTEGGQRDILQGGNSRDDIATETEGEVNSILKAEWERIKNWLFRFDDALVDEYTSAINNTVVAISSAKPRAAGYQLYERKVSANQLRDVVDERINTDRQSAASAISSIVRYRGNCVKRRRIIPIPNDGRSLPFRDASYGIALYPVSANQPVEVYRQIVLRFVASELLRIAQYSRRLLSIDVCRSASLLFPHDVVTRIVRDLNWFTFTSQDVLTEAHFFNIRAYCVAVPSGRTMKDQELTRIIRVEKALVKKVMSEGKDPVIAELPVTLYNYLANVVRVSQVEKDSLREKLSGLLNVSTNSEDEDAQSSRWLLYFV